jgi:hypothetical protein
MDRVTAATGGDYLSDRLLDAQKDHQESDRANGGIED